jgi:hypothetical protein
MKNTSIISSTVSERGTNRLPCGFGLQSDDGHQSIRPAPIGKAHVSLRSGGWTS